MRPYTLQSRWVYESDGFRKGPLLLMLRCIFHCWDDSLLEPIHNLNSSLGQIQPSSYLGNGILNQYV